MDVGLVVKTFTLLERAITPPPSVPRVTPERQVGGTDNKGTRQGRDTNKHRALGQQTDDFPFGSIQTSYREAK